MVKKKCDKCKGIGVAKLGRCIKCNGKGVIASKSEKVEVKKAPAKKEAKLKGKAKK